MMCVVVSSSSSSSVERKKKKRSKELTAARTKCVQCGKGDMTKLTACPDGFCCKSCYKKELRAAKKQKK